jgi:hypothetical protein
MKITASVPANLSWHQCIGCLEEMARKMGPEDIQRISIHDAKRLGALVGLVETVVEYREQLAIQEANVKNIESNVLTKHLT